MSMIYTQPVIICSAVWPNTITAEMHWSVRTLRVGISTITFAVCCLKKGSSACNSHYFNSRNSKRIVIDKIKEHILTKEELRGRQSQSR